VLQVLPSLSDLPVKIKFTLTQKVLVIGNKNDDLVCVCIFFNFCSRKFSQLPTLPGLVACFLMAILDSWGLGGLFSRRQFRLVLQFKIAAIIRVKILL